MGQRLFVCMRFPEANSSATRALSAVDRYFGSDAVSTSDSSGLATLEAADVVIALIDEHWTGKPADENTSILSDPSSVARSALVAASSSGKPIVPILLDGLSMPDVDDLPDDLRFLHFLNALGVRNDAQFADDMTRACQAIMSVIHDRRLMLQAWAGFGVGVGWLSFLSIIGLIGVLGHLTNNALLIRPASVITSWHDSRAVVAAIFLPLVMASLFVGWNLLRARRWFGAAVLACSATLMLIEVLRPVAPMNYQAPWNELDVVAALLSNPLLLPGAGVAIVTLLAIGLRTGRLTYTSRTVRFATRTLAEEALEERGVRVGVYVSSRSEDRSAAYEAMCAYLDKRLTRDKDLQRPIWQPSHLPAAEHTDEWQALLAQSTDVLVVIGPHWLTATDADGHPALADSADPVRREIEAAIRQGKTLIPVLLNGAAVPHPSQLPTALASLGFMRAVSVRGSRGNVNDFGDILLRLLGSDRGLLMLLLVVIDMIFFQFTPDLFISYRRSDSGRMAARISRAMRYPWRVGHALFRDTDAISAGVNFLTVLLNALRESKVVLVLIGPDWLNLTNANGKRRLDDPSDMVRREIVTALSNDKTVIPVLINGAQMPPAADLPDGLRALASKAPFRMGSDATFRQDMSRLYGLIRRPLGIYHHPLLMWMSVATLGLWWTLWVYYAPRRQVFLTYLYRLHPAWCSLGRNEHYLVVQECFATPDVTVIHTILTLATCSGILTLALCIVGAYTLVRGGPTIWAVGLWILLVVEAFSLSLLYVSFMGYVPASAVLFQSGNTVYFTLGPLRSAEFSAQMGALLSAYLIPCFWRSKGRPQPLKQ